MLGLDSTRLIRLSTRRLYQIIFIIVTAGIVSSLYFQFFLGLQPCTLCIVQRIFWIGQFIILAIPKITYKNRLEVGLILNIFSLLTALYQTYLQTIAKPGLSLTGWCDGQIVSCSTIQLRLFGILTIPMLSTIGSIVLTVLYITALKTKSSNTSP